MKISLYNLGPILEFHFDLEKDLNIIFGKNNIGKSYAITAVYLILKNLLNKNEITIINEKQINFFYDYGLFNQKYIFDGKNSEDCKRQLINKIREKKVKEINIKDDITNLLKELIQQSSLIENLESSFKNSFSSIDTISNAFTLKPFSVTLIYSLFEIRIECIKSHFTIKELIINKDIILKKALTHRNMISDNNLLTLYYNSKKNTIEDFNILIYTFYSKINSEVTKYIKNVYFLPASRSGLYQALSTFSAIIAELSKSRNFLRSKIELPNISEPVSDYFLYLSNINTTNSTNKKFDDIIRQIENEIIDGRVLFNRDTKKIYFSSKKTNLELDLSFTSSMISEIAPIVAYLKYIVKDNTERAYLNLEYQKGQDDNRYSLIFIEEPEAHLHPEVQVALLEIFTKLIDRKIKIIMTTHSNYMFNKLSNLVLSDNLSHERVGSYLMKMTPKGSKIDYVAMKADEDGIIDNNFADIAESLYEERIAIYDSLNKKNNAD